MGISLAIVGAVILVGSFLLPHLPVMLHAILGFVGLLIFLAGLGLTIYSSLYRKTSADMAFVVTGRGGSNVVLDGGALVWPLFHQVTEVGLRTMKLGVNPHGPNALITHDNLRSDILAQFYIRVQADKDHILNAARSLGQTSINAESVESLVSEKLVSALRAIASQMDLFEIHTKRDEFAERVKEHVKSDLEANGLLLESVTISELDQTDPTVLSDNNVFDAQGKRKITEITTAALVERNNLERAAEQARKTQDVSTRQQILELERKQAEAEANQRTEIAKIQAEQGRQAQEATIAQERSVEIAQMEKDQAVQAAAIAREQTLQVATVAKEKAVQAATIAREQELQKAGVERDQAVAVAEKTKQIAVANQETERAKSEELSLRAQAAQEKANQEVMSVTQISEAEREAGKKLIAARQEIERDKIRQQTEAEVLAYTRVTQAQAELDAASKQAEARLKLAHADAESRELVARGEKAQQMVAVDISRENVGVEQAKVDVERRQLENRQEFADAGIRLEVEKLRIQADVDVQQEYAKALANFLSRGNMTLYGTPETAQHMMDNMARGFGIRAVAEGFLSGANGLAGNGSHDASAGSDRVGALIDTFGKILGPAIEKMTGQRPTAEAQSAALAEAFAANPEAMQSLAAALASKRHVEPTRPAVVVPGASTPNPTSAVAPPAVVSPTKKKE